MKRSPILKCAISMVVSMIITHSLVSVDVNIFDFKNWDLIVIIIGVIYSYILSQAYAEYEQHKHVIHATDGLASNDKEFFLASTLMHAILMTSTIQIYLITATVGTLDPSFWFQLILGSFLGIQITAFIIGFLHYVQDTLEAVNKRKTIVGYDHDLVLPYYLKYTFTYGLDFKGIDVIPKPHILLLLTTIILVVICQYVKNLFLSWFIYWYIFMVLTAPQFHRYLHYEKASSILNYLGFLQIIIKPADHAYHHQSEIYNYSLHFSWVNHIIDYLIRFGKLPRYQNIGSTSPLDIKPDMNSMTKKEKWQAFQENFDFHNKWKQIYLTGNRESLSILNKEN